MNFVSSSAVLLAVVVIVLAEENVDTNAKPKGVMPEGFEEQMPEAPKPITHHCSRKMSREARSILTTEMYDQLKHMKYTLPETCPFYQGLDLYARQERFKKEVRHNQWKCLFCSKVFKLESFLDTHMDARHPTELKSSPNVCLGDFCPFLGCHSSQEDDSVIPLAYQRCNPQKMATRRYECNSLMNKCFPPKGSEIAVRLHDEFSHKYCSVLVCGDDENESFGPPQIAQRERAAQKAEGWSKMYIVILILGAIALAMFYLGLFLFKREMKTHPDMSPLNAARRAARLKMLKEKNY